MPLHLVCFSVRRSNTGNDRLEAGLLAVTKFSEQHFFLFTVMLPKSSSWGRREDLKREWKTVCPSFLNCVQSLDSEPRARPGTEKQSVGVHTWAAVKICRRIHGGACLLGSSSLYKCEAEVKWEGGPLYASPHEDSGRLPFSPGSASLG